jgi:hypothetical protein
MNEDTWEEYGRDFYEYKEKVKELEARTLKAISELNKLRDKSQAHEWMRLQGKAEGVDLVLQYIREML